MPQTDTPTQTTRPMALGTHAAAATLGISRSKFFQLVREGRIATFRIGSKVMVACTELERFISDATKGR